MPIEIRASGRDVVVLTYRGVLSDQEYEEALRTMAQELESAVSERRKIGFLSVGSTDSNMSARQRQRTGDWVKSHESLLRSACAAHAVVVPGAIQRGVLTAILWIVSYPVPMRPCASEAEGEVWVRSHLPRESLHV